MLAVALGVAGCDEGRSGSGTGAGEAGGTSQARCNTDGVCQLATDAGEPAETCGVCPDCTADIPQCGACGVDQSCGTDDACTCQECVDLFECTAESCTDDGTCEYFDEGCSCVDCMSEPECSWAG